MKKVTSTQYKHPNPYIQKYAEQNPNPFHSELIEQTKFSFPNGYTASVICGKAVLGFEIAIIVDGSLVHHHLLGNDIVLNGLTQAEADELVTKIYDIVVEEDNKPF